MSLPNRIALFGNAYSGKSSIASKLVQDYGYIRLSFADPLKEKWIEEEIEKIYGRKTSKAERRRIYRLLADFIKSNSDYSFFIKELDKKFKRFLVLGNDKFVIDDVRFALEANWCVLNLFRLVFVDTREEVLFERARANGEDPEELYNHLSEAQIPIIKHNFKHLTVNGEEDIEKAIRQLFKEFQKKEK